MPGVLFLVLLPKTAPDIRQQGILCAFAADTQMGTVRIGETRTLQTSRTRAYITTSVSHPPFASRPATRMPNCTWSISFLRLHVSTARPSAPRRPRSRLMERISSDGHATDPRKTLGRLVMIMSARTSSSSKRRSEPAGRLRPSPEASERGYHPGPGHSLLHLGTRIEQRFRIERQTDAHCYFH
jgi:hypothetical protein